LVWLLLVAATVVSWGIGHGVGISDARIGAVAILATAFIKVRFVMFEFMELRDAPGWMRRAAGGWVVTVAALLVARVLIGL
jgi:hypothetical protein